VDVVVDRFPVGIVVETKSPRTRLTDDCIEQLEAYVFHKHTRGRAATVAILTNGELFYIYGVIEPLRKGTLSAAVQRRWLDEQLVGKVEGVPNQQAVSADGAFPTWETSDW
jgi:hypothetical protein